MKNFAKQMEINTPPALDGEEADRIRAEIKRLQRDEELLNDPETLCSFGQMAFDGDGMEQDYREAEGWWKIAAKQGHSRSQHNLATMYETGEGAPRDLSEAVKWYKLAAEQGNAGSQNNLGALFECGTGVPQDFKMALELYRQAARGGDSNGTINALRLERLMRKEGKTV